MVHRFLNLKFVWILNIIDCEITFKLSLSFMNETEKIQIKL